MVTHSDREPSHQNSRRSRIKKSTPPGKHAAARAADSSLAMLVSALVGGGAAREAEYPATVEDTRWGASKMPDMRRCSTASPRSIVHGRASRACYSIASPGRTFMNALGSLKFVFETHDWPNPDHRPTENRPEPNQKLNSTPRPAGYKSAHLNPGRDGSLARSSQIDLWK